MQIGLIGAGRIGSFHARTLRSLPGVTELIVADADPERAAQVAAEVGARSAPHPEALLDAAPDAVVIASATSSHPELIVAAARAGLPTFCEKPIALDLAGTLAVLREVEAAGTTLQIGFMRRFDAGYRAAREAVRSGRLGRLHTVRAVTSDAAPPPAAFLPLSGGLIRDCLVHDFDILRWVTGREVVSAYATGSDAGPPMFAEAGDVDTAAVLLTLDDGTLATATATRMNGAGYDIRMELAGERDQIAVGWDSRTPLISVEPSAPARTGEAWHDFMDRFAPAYTAELAAFLQVARNEITNPCDGREALHALRVAEACEQSRLTGRPVALDEQAAPDPSAVPPAG
ncbi:Gfo/Idh/MocA family oxidoreductase [Streptomyces sp. 549]|uniref:Gfo/Idh/MocA family protein n=1 Tax=Streptomyces sp. 549 TaxID=3049076 RepID=UPI0024C44EAD|nr:Gfo/Idh/MocA family oxidoreductase [Streptomyces sp. 549]MDK1472194.1 Gfo/Idh/MocA family oxidoreductase [Streptomyces sp. 549]